MVGTQAHPHKQWGKPAAFFLAGDSTTAKQIAVNGGGWGNGFLGTLKNGATGINYGHNGATTVSFVAGGDWATVLASVRNSTAYTPYVTISFGHNDQKADKNISVAQYTTNLKNMGLQVRQAGGQPIFVTSVSRRNYNSSGVVKEDLAVQAAATISAAKSIKADYIDLNRASTTYLNAIGEANGHEYNLTPNDNTHLSKAGSVLFGNIVSILLNGLVRESYGEWTSPNRTIEQFIKKGEFILPSVE
ncbi:carbohydrate esterase family 12 protein [Bisporella sp. PMI_857]|nr:carbohydrate esterase family 12 protein [Bisporella sp. PMI_857]